MLTENTRTLDLENWKISHLWTRN